MAETQVLKTFSHPVWDRDSGGVVALIEEMKGSFPEEERRKFAVSMRDPKNVEEYERGYEEGKRVGLNSIFLEWRGDIEYTYSLLLSMLDPALVLLVMVNGVLMISDLTPKGKTVPPEFEPPLRRIFDTALWAQEFRATVVPVLEKLDREGFFTFVELMVSEVAHAMRQAGKEWVAGFYALTGQPRAQGFYTGKLIGEACGMVLRSAVEEMTGVSLLDTPQEAVEVLP